MKLRTKIRLISVIPVLILGIVAVILSSLRLKTAIEETAYNGMDAAAISISKIFDATDSGDYFLTGSRKLYKGQFCISEAFDIVDDIKKSSGLDITIFYGDTRFLTSVTASDGSRQVGTKAEEAVVQKVLWNGETYHDDNITLLGERYASYYAPLYDSSSADPVGMIFIGKRYNEIANILNSNALSVGIPVVLIVLVCVLISAVVIRDTISRLTFGINSLTALSDGNLNLEVPEAYVKRGDIIGQLCKTLVKLDESLKATIASLKDQCSSLYRSAETCSEAVSSCQDSISSISGSMQEVAESTTTQALDSERANRSIIHMGELIVNTSERSGEMNNIANQMSDASASAQTSLDALSGSMANVQNAVEIIAQQTQKTHESVAKIQNAASLIYEIAEQTNLLSLNASIEAARAGEHGRGFAVVATEIQSLAAQSSHSAEQIQDTLDELRVNSDKSIEKMKEVQATVLEQREKLRSADEVFAQLSTGILASAENVTLVSSDISELDTERGSTIEVVNEVSTASQRIAKNAEETASSLKLVHDMVVNIESETRDIKHIAGIVEGEIAKFTL